MNKEHEDHLQSIKDDFLTDVDTKYRKGAKEHGGNLWEKKGLVEMGLEEAVDLYVYLKTLQQQLKRVDLGTLEDNQVSVKTAPTLVNQKTGEPYDKI